MWNNSIKSVSLKADLQIITCHHEKRVFTTYVVTNIAFVLRIPGRRRFLFLLLLICTVLDDV